MSFGFSVGDFIAVGKIASEIIGCLNSISGSNAEYQELCRELDLLKIALQKLEKLSSDHSTTDTSTNIESIIYATLSCRHPLEEFLQKVKKYDKHLGAHTQEKSSISSLKRATSKVSWQLKRKEEIRKLQCYLTVHLGTINILLAEHGLQVLNIQSSGASHSADLIRQGVEDTRTILDRVKGTITGQAILIQATNAMLRQLFGMVNGEIRSSWRSLSNMVSKVFISTQQTYSLLLEIKGSLSMLPDSRFLYFQQPICLEDALGRKFPIPSEYDYGLLDRIIQYKFQDGPGSLEVQAGNYQLSSAKNSRIIFTPDVELLPGVQIIMAILIEPASLQLTGRVCPMRRCGSQETSMAPGGGRICCTCGIWFDASNKIRKPLQKLLDAVEKVERNDVSLVSNLVPEPDENPKKRLKILEEETFLYVKNVRTAITERTPLHTTNSAQHPRQIEVKTKTEFAADVGSFDTWTISLSAEGSTARAFVEFDEVISFVNLVKHTYRSNPEVYEEFLRGLNAFDSYQLSVWMIEELMTLLFTRELNLLEKFQAFIPPESATVTRIAKLVIPNSNESLSIFSAALAATKRFHGLRMLCRDVDEIRFDNVFREILDKIYSGQMESAQWMNNYITEYFVNKPMILTGSKITKDHNVHDIGSAIFYEPATITMGLRFFQDFDDSKVLLKQLAVQDLADDLKKGLIEAATFIEKTTALIYLYRNLIDGLNGFLPDGYRIDRRTTAESYQIHIICPEGDRFLTYERLGGSDSLGDGEDIEPSDDAEQMDPQVEEATGKRKRGMLDA